MNQFKTKQDVVDFLSQCDFLTIMPNGHFYPSGTYYLAHGEYSQPEYCTRRYKDGWGIHAIYFYYQGTCYAPQDGRVSDDKFLKYFLEVA